jgi:tRNA (guanine37-N1)-methyltransferase
MDVHVLTIFPEMFASFLQASLLGRAVARGRMRVRLWDIRDYAQDRHRSTDDLPYGGGPGMVMKPEPIVTCLEAVAAQEGLARRVLLTPAGPTFDQRRAHDLAAARRIVLVCGRYEGVDERVRSYVDDELSVGDYVLSGGEVAAMTVIDAVARLCPGVLGDETSLLDESFAAGLLEYPQYTRPPVFRGVAVPATLLMGDHARIAAWRRRLALLRTRERRPDLFARLVLSDEDRRLLEHDE